MNTRWLRSVVARLSGGFVLGRAARRRTTRTRRQARTANFATWSERLEERQLPAAYGSAMLRQLVAAPDVNVTTSGTSFDPASGQLTINGTPGADRIAVRTLSSGSVEAKINAAPAKLFRNVKGVSIDSGAGNDTITVTSNIATFVNAGAGNDVVTTAGGNDTLIGEAGNDRLTAGAGNDVLVGGVGNDVLNGGVGIDKVFEDLVNLDARLTRTLANANGSDTISNVEHATLIGNERGNRLDASAFTGSVALYGLAGDDTLTGGSAADELVGGDGQDQLDGKAGANTLDGGAGSDTLRSQATNVLRETTADSGIDKWFGGGVLELNGVPRTFDWFASETATTSVRVIARPTDGATLGQRVALPNLTSLVAGTHDLTATGAAFTVFKPVSDPLQKIGLSVGAGLSAHSHLLLASEAWQTRRASDASREFVAALRDARRIELLPFGARTVLDAAAFELSNVTPLIADGEAFAEDIVTLADLIEMGDVSATANQVEQVTQRLADAVAAQQPRAAEALRQLGMASQDIAAGWASARAVAADFRQGLEFAQAAQPIEAASSFADVFNQAASLIGPFDATLAGTLSRGGQLLTDFGQWVGTIGDLVSSGENLNADNATEFTRSVREVLTRAAGTLLDADLANSVQQASALVIDAETAFDLGRQFAADAQEFGDALQDGDANNAGDVFQRLTDRGEALLDLVDPAAAGAIRELGVQATRFGNAAEEVVQLVASFGDPRFNDPAALVSSLSTAFQSVSRITQQLPASTAAAFAPVLDTLRDTLGGLSEVATTVATTARLFEDRDVAGAITSLGAAFRQVSLLLPGDVSRQLAGSQMAGRLQQIASATTGADVANAVANGLTALRNGNEAEAIAAFANGGNVLAAAILNRGDLQIIRETGDIASEVLTHLRSVQGSLRDQDFRQAGAVLAETFIVLSEHSAIPAGSRTALLDAARFASELGDVVQDVSDLRTNIDTLLSQFEAGNVAEGAAAFEKVAKGLAAVVREHVSATAGAKLDVVAAAAGDISAAVTDSLKVGQAFESGLNQLKTGDLTGVSELAKAFQQASRLTERLPGATSDGVLKGVGDALDSVAGLLSDVGTVLTTLKTGDFHDPAEVLGAVRSMLTQAANGASRLDPTTSVAFQDAGRLIGRAATLADTAEQLLRHGATLSEAFKNNDSDQAAEALTAILTKVSDLAKRADPSGTGGLSAVGKAIDDQLTHIGETTRVVFNLTGSIRAAGAAAKADDPLAMTSAVAAALQSSQELVKKVLPNLKLPTVLADARNGLNRIGSVVTDVTNVLLNVRSIDFETQPAESLRAVASALTSTGNLFSSIAGANETLKHVAEKFTSIAGTVASSTGVALSIVDGIKALKSGDGIAAGLSFASATQQFVAVLAQRTGSAVLGSISTHLTVAITSFQVGQFVGSQIPDSRLLATIAGADVGARIGTLILPGIGTFIGTIAGGLGGLFGSRSADHAFKAQRLAADQQSQLQSTKNLAAFWAEVLSQVQYAKASEFAAFANFLIARNNNGHESYAFDGISITADQMDALIFVAATLTRRELQKISNLTTLEQIPGFGQAYRDFLMEYTFIERNGQVVPTENLEQRRIQLEMAGLSVQPPAVAPAVPTPLPTAHYVGFLDDVAGLPPVSFDQESVGQFSVTGGTSLASPGDVVLSHRGTAFVLYKFSDENLRGIAEIDPISQTVLRTLMLPSWANSRWTYNNSLALSPDQNFLAVGTGSAAGFLEDDQRVFVIDVDTFQIVNQFTGFRAVSQVTFSRDGLSLYVGDARGWSGSRIAEIDMVGRKEVRSWNVPDLYMGRFTLGPDNDRFFLYSESTNRMGVLHQATGQFNGLVDLPFTARFATVDPTNRLLWIVDHTGSKVWKFDLATETIAGSVSIPYGANHLALSRTGSFVFAVSAYTGMLTVLDVTDLSVEQSLKVAEGASNVAYDAVAGQLFVTDNGGGKLVVLRM